MGNIYFLGGHQLNWRNMGLLNLLKQKKSLYAIDEESIKKHSKFVFNSLMKFYSDTKKITDSQGFSQYHKEISRSIEDDLGIGPGTKFSESIINNDNFRILVIYNLGLSNILNYKLSFSSYNFYKQMLDKILEENKTIDSISNDSKLIKSFLVNPKTLPVSYKQFISSVDEFTLATSFIVKKIMLLKKVEKTQTYEEYYSYLNSEIKKLIIELHDNGFYNTHEEERFTTIVLSYICKFPSMDTLYKKPINERVITNGVSDIPTKTMRDIQKNLFELLEGLRFGGNDETGFD
jgi:hypothetical protein